MSIQERRMGGYFQFGFNYKRWIFQLDTLLMLAEKNYWVEDKRIRKELETGMPQSEAVRMRFGLGDTRLRAGYKIFDSDRLKTAVGLEAILPTSRIFEKSSNRVISTKPGDTRKKFIEDLMNLSKHIMINPRLGTGHWGFGGFFDWRFSIIPRKLDIWGRFSYDHFLPRNEYRFMPTAKPINLTDVGELFMTGKVSDDFPLDSVFPALVKGRVHPGDIFNATLGLDWRFGKKKNWKFGISYDYYLQQGEKIKDLDSSGINLSEVFVKESLASKMVQHKICGDISYTKKGRHIDWNFGVGGDTTFSSQAGPRDWTIFGKIGIKF
jgi:hypothetical protein